MSGEAEGMATAERAGPADDLRAALPALAAASLAARRAFIRALRAGIAADPHTDAALAALLEVPDPLAAREEWTAPGGERVVRERVPIGVVGIVYGGRRAGYAAQAAALGVLCGNAVALSPSRRLRAATEPVLVAIHAALKAAGLPPAVKVGTPTKSEAKVGVPTFAEKKSAESRDTHFSEILSGCPDFLILRGGAELQAAAVSGPVMRAGPGDNHLYVDASADPDAVGPLLSMERVREGRCTAPAALLLHAAVADAVRARLPADAPPVHVVPDVAAAVAHIRAHGSGHSEAIAARDPAAIAAFRAGVDAAFILVNAPFAILTGGGLGLSSPGLGIRTERVPGRGMITTDMLVAPRLVVEGPPLPDNAAVRRARRRLFPHHETPSEMDAMPPRGFRRARGCTLWDFDGRPYLDGLSMLWVVNAGHGQPEIVDAVVRQARALPYGTLYGGFLHEPALELADLLAEITPGDLEKTFLATGGSEAVDVAMKFARVYHLARGDGRRKKILSFEGSYHGMTRGALSATGVAPLRAPFEPLLPGFARVAPPLCPQCPLGLKYPSCALACADAVARAADEAGADEVAAFVAEPVLSPMGNWPPPEGYWPRVQAHLEARGILLVFDEVRTGCGRTGAMFACEDAGVVPDLLVLGKGLASGYAPVSAVVVRRGVAEALENEMCRDGFTFGGHPLGAAAAIANLRFIQERDLVARARAAGARLAAALRAATADIPVVGGVWGCGLHLAVAYRDRAGDRPAPREARLPYRVEEAAWRRGLYLGRASPTFTHVAPPLVVSDAEIERLVDGIRGALQEVATDTLPCRRGDERP